MFMGFKKPIISTDKRTANDTLDRLVDSVQKLFGLRQ
jgi:hypothetical protein